MERDFTGDTEAREFEEQLRKRGMTAKIKRIHGPTFHFKRGKTNLVGSARTYTIGGRVRFRNQIYELTHESGSELIEIWYDDFTKRFAHAKLIFLYVPPKVGTETVYCMPIETYEKKEMETESNPIHLDQPVFSFMDLEKRIFGGVSARLWIDVDQDNS